MENVVSFSAPGVPDYLQITFDLERSQLLVGARDFLFRLNLTTLDIYESAEWSPTEQQAHMCVQKGQTKVSASICVYSVHMYIWQDVVQPAKNIWLMEGLICSAELSMF